MAFTADVAISGGSSSRAMGYEIVSTNHPPEGAHTARRLLRYLVVSAALLGVIGVIGVAAIVGLVEGMDVHRYFQRTSSMRGAVSLVAEPVQKPYRNEPSCADDDSVCICTGSHQVTGKDRFGFNTLVKNLGYTACQQWHFEIGDVLLVEKPAQLHQKYIPAFVQSFVSNSDIVHAAIVTKVPNKGVKQTSENVIVTEALKGSWKQVVQNTIRTLVERYPFGGVSIRRVDVSRFPGFETNKAAISAWADARLGEPFDKNMLIPFKRRFTTGDRYISKSGFCWDRKRALKMYESEQKGPGKWICSQFVAWALAYPGGLNMNYGDVGPGCTAPQWTIKNLQPLPGDLMSQEFYAAGKWKVPCDASGCYIGVPAIPDWAGGTTSTTSTTTTSTTTTSTSTSATSTTSTSTTSSSTSSNHGTTTAMTASKDKSSKRDKSKHAIAGGIKGKHENTDQDDERSEESAGESKRQRDKTHAANRHNAAISA